MISQPACQRIDDASALITLCKRKTLPTTNSYNQQVGATLHVGNFTANVNRARAIELPSNICATMISQCMRVHSEKNAHDPLRTSRRKERNEYSRWRKDSRKIDCETVVHPQCKQNTMTNPCAVKVGENARLSCDLFHAKR